MNNAVIRSLRKSIPLPGIKDWVTRRLFTEIVCIPIYTVGTLNKASELAGIQATILHGIYDDNKHKDGKFKFELGVSYFAIFIMTCVTIAVVTLI